MDEIRKLFYRRKTFFFERSDIYESFLDRHSNRTILWRIVRFIKINSIRSIDKHQTEGKFVSVDKMKKHITEGIRDTLDEHSFGRRVDNNQNLYVG